MPYVCTHKASSIVLFTVEELTIHPKSYNPESETSWSTVRDCQLWTFQFWFLILMSPFLGQRTTSILISFQSQQIKIDKMVCSVLSTSVKKKSWFYVLILLGSFHCNWKKMFHGIFFMLKEIFTLCTHSLFLIFGAKVLKVIFF